MKHSEALNVAKALVGYFEPACKEIKIVGSVSRGKPEVKDIEMLIVPDLTPPAAPKLEFGKPMPKSYKSVLDELVGRMYQAGDCHILANGERQKKLGLKYAGIVCELYIVIPPAEWGVQCVIRTGPKDFSHWCVTNREFGGALPDGYFCKHGVIWVGEEIGKRDIPDDQNKAMKLLTDTNHLSMPEEVDFLNFLELGWIEPKDRIARWKR